jgi:hypothetical protein
MAWNVNIYVYLLWMWYNLLINKIIKLFITLKKYHYIFKFIFGVNILNIYFMFNFIKSYFKSITNTIYFFENEDW